MSVDTWKQIAAAISRATGAPFESEEVRDLGGGCINRAVCLSGGGRNYFVKVNEPSAGAMFEAEREGLDTLRGAASIRVPAPIVEGGVEDMAFLVLEYIPLSHLAGEGWSWLGEQLAAMHRHTTSCFGWHRDNTIGATPQPNGWQDDWTGFWRDRRLGYQLRLASDNGLPASVARNGERLLERVDALLAEHDPAPSLLHGDLWGGNVAAGEQGEPVLFDPAVYYGDREADLAMTELFGSFDARFYEAYRAAWPLEPGYRRRRTLYNLYHVLNHFNLFGGGYANQAGGMIDSLLGQC